jgi:hypothetical protein
MLPAASREWPIARGTEWRLRSYRWMERQVRSCSLIIAGERYAGFDCVIGTLPGPSFAFLSGPPKPLKLAQMSPPVELQFPGEPSRAVTITRVNDVGMALAVLEPEKATPASECD